MTTNYIPKRLIDAHHHFVDTTPDGNAESFHSFLASFLPNERYLPADYVRDVVLPLREGGIELKASVHVECMPNDGLAEAQWIASFGNSPVRAIVASCDLAAGTCLEDLARLSTLPQISGVRWILDCVGRFQPNTATHIGTIRHDGIDYLRGGHGVDTWDGGVVPAFEAGFAALARHGFSFDLQCAPVQLPAAAALCARHPTVPVCIDHLGKPRMLLGPDGDDPITTTPNALELENWRTGMKAMAALPHVYVKLSMLGYAVPGWMKTPAKRELLKDLVQQVLELFTPQRCMVALNWWKNAAVSDSDFLSNVGPSPLEYVQFIADCMEHYCQEDKDRVFYGTAAEFYRMEILD